MRHRTSKESKNMRAIALLVCVLSVCSFNTTATEKPVQHLKVADVTSAIEAKKVFFETTAQIKSKKILDEQELHDIHFITYSLEKSIAYYAENLTGKSQKLAEKMAVVVEDIHINSENNRKEQTKKHLKKYFELAAKLSQKIWF